MSLVSDCPNNVTKYWIFFGDALWKRILINGFYKMNCN